MAIKLKGLDLTHSKCEKLLTIRFKLKHLHQQSVKFLALYICLEKRECQNLLNPYLIIGWEDGVLGPGGIWGQVQGVGSNHWGTRSLPSLGLHPREAQTRAKRAF